MEKNTKGIRAFLHDAKAVSPAIATLILIVIAAVAAAGVGILVQSAQKNAGDQTANKDMSVNGEFGIKGSTTVLPISQHEITDFSKKYPAIKITTAGGGSGTGRALVFNKQVDVAASSDIWPNGPQTDPTTGLKYDGREKAVIQGTGQDAFIYETKIGTGMIVVAGNVKIGATQAKAINVVNNTVASGWDAGNATLTVNTTALRAAYIGTTSLSIGGQDIAVVQRSDDSGTEETFAKWINVKNSVGQLDSSAHGESGNQGIRDYIASTPNTIGFVDIGFAAGGANGKDLVTPASQNGIQANSTTSGANGAYNAASKLTNTGLGVASDKTSGLARDLYYYSQGIPTGAVKAYLDFVLSNDGQKIVEQEGFFRAVQ
ncbi:MAG: substrate-binding domain-containing protein [Candidatus Methanoperedens sp.]|nr:substrate-binding domain-containing protein [Candidatus Methanoperedens sp.]